MAHHVSHCLDSIPTPSILPFGGWVPLLCLLVSLQLVVAGDEAVVNWSSTGCVRRLHIVMIFTVAHIAVTTTEQLVPNHHMYL